MKKLILMVSVVTMMAGAGALAAEKKAKAPAAPAAPVAAAAPAKSSTTAWSRPYGQAGCGLGSMVVGKKGGQIFAATTNGTAYNQLFGITFGTSNCVDGPNSQVALRMDNFIAGNKAALAGDMARGSGETLATLTSLMGCQGGAEKVGAAMQRNFREIYPDVSVTPNEITDSVISVVKTDGELAGTCSQII